MDPVSRMVSGLKASDVNSQDLSYLNTTSIPVEGMSKTSSFKIAISGLGSAIEKDHHTKAVISQNKFEIAGKGT